MLQIGTAFVNLRPKWWLISIVQVLSYLAFIFYFEYLLITTTIIFSEDLNSANESAHFCVLGILMLIIIVNYPLKRRNFIDLMRIVAKNYFQYNDGYKSDSVERWKKNTQKLKSRMLVLVTGYFIVVLTVKIFIAPLIDQYQGYDTDDYIKGVYMKLPIPLWLPYQIDGLAKKLATLGTEAIGGSMLISVIIGADLILIFQSVDIILQMRILRDSIKHLETRAMLLYNQWNGTTYNPDEGCKLRRGDPSFMKALNYCIKQNAQHHRIISRAFYNIYDLGSVPLAAAFLIGSAIIALSLFNFATSKLRIGPQIFSLMLLVAEVCNMALICFVGQELSDLVSIYTFII
ncbi:hypothetical protein O3M35_002955 [Rhynocoris fuscipes]|uniref:Odorant receptor n=1 Tax=Rhynocoris fuscipes TaxID=488301 RepID=A0AAW1CIH8_9HEMI